MQVRTAWKP